MAAKPNSPHARDLANGSDDDGAAAGPSGQGKTQRIAKGQSHRGLYFSFARLHCGDMQLATDAGSRRANASPRRTRATRANRARRPGQVSCACGVSRPLRELNCPLMHCVR